jgi:hypothetical protein
MNVNLLIDAIVRQTTVLIAQLATTAGVRAPLAHTADQVFGDLVRELKEQGVGNKVIADMFGLALRTYHNRVQRLSESTTFRGRSLWQAVLEYIEENETVLQGTVLSRFARDDEASVRSVLTDLVESGLIFRMGRGAHVTFRAARPEDHVATVRSADVEGAQNIVWLAVHRMGPATIEQIAAAVPLERDALTSALGELVRMKRVTREGQGAATLYRSDECVIPFGNPTGWEAAVFDHYQAMVTAICTKLRLGNTRADAKDTIGGSTFGFDIWRGHPHEEEVLGLLSRLRAESSGLRAKVAAYNAAHPRADEAGMRVIAYVGQTIVEAEAPEAPGDQP